MWGSVTCLCRPAQFAEETKRADRNVPCGMVTAVICEAGLGLAFTLAFFFSLPVRARASLVTWPCRCAAC